MSNTTLSHPPSAHWLASRWLQLAVGIVCMIATANIQYAWTLFVPLSLIHI